MKKITCIIIDSQQAARERLTQLLKLDRQVKIVGQASEAEMAAGLIGSQRVELVFVAAEMPGSSAFKVIKRIRAAGYVPTFIFTANNGDHIIQAIRHGVFDYLIQPIDLIELQASIHRYQQMKRSAADLRLL